MHLSVYEQGEVFYFSFIFGLFIGLYYDIYRFLRYIGFISKTSVMIQDLCFMCTSAVATFLFSQMVVNGHIRAYVITAVLFGAVSYRYSFGLLSTFMFKLLRAILNYIRRILTRAVSFLSAQYHRICIGLSVLCKRMVSFIKRTNKVDIN